MPDHYAVIGHPITHSKSPLIHALFARATGQALEYVAIDGGVGDGALARTLSAFRAAGGRGANVTLPFKPQALAAADVASADARAAGAANALRWRPDGRLEAANFDGIGLVRDITVNLGVALAGARVLVLGAGGAARGAILPLARAGCVRIAIANRSAEKAAALAQELAPHLPPGCALTGGALLAREAEGGHEAGHEAGHKRGQEAGPEPGHERRPEGGHETVHETRQATRNAQAAASAAPAYRADPSDRFDIVINATSASLSGAAPAVPGPVLARAHLAYDMVDGQVRTPFLAAAQQAGCAHIADGAGMLVEQAAEAFAWWRGVRPQTGEALALLRAG